MKKYLVYMTCAAAAMIGGTGCSDFGDVNMDPEHLNSENIPTELLFTNGQHQISHNPPFLHPVRHERFR